MTCHSCLSDHCSLQEHYHTSQASRANAPPATSHITTVTTRYVQLACIMCHPPLTAAQFSTISPLFYSLNTLSIDLSYNSVRQSSDMWHDL